MVILQEIKLTNTRKEKDPVTGEEKLVDHFKQRRDERVNWIEPSPSWNSFMKDLPEGTDRTPIYRVILDEIVKRVNDNINKTASIDTSKDAAALIEVGDLRIKKGDKITSLQVHSNEGDGSHYYIPVVKDQATTLMIVTSSQEGEWKEQHFRNLQRTRPDLGLTNSSQIATYRIDSPIVIINYDSIVNTISKRDNMIEQEMSFNVKELPYKPQSDYRPNSGGKKQYLELNVPTEGWKKLPIISNGVIDNDTKTIAKVEIDTGSPGNAMAFKMKLNGKVQNGFKPIEVETKGSTLVLKNLFISGAFDKKGNYTKTYQASIEEQIQLLEKLTRKKVVLK